MFFRLICISQFMNNSRSIWRVNSTNIVDWPIYHSIGRVRVRIEISREGPCSKLSISWPISRRTWPISWRICASMALPQVGTFLSCCCWFKQPLGRHHLKVNAQRAWIEQGFRQRLRLFLYVRGFMKSNFDLCNICWYKWIWKISSPTGDHNWFPYQKK